MLVVAFGCHCALHGLLEGPKGINDKVVYEGTVKSNAIGIVHGKLQVCGKKSLNIHIDISFWVIFYLMHLIIAVTIWQHGLLASILCT